LRFLPILLLAATCITAPAYADPSLDQALNAPTRSPKFVARDTIRHPVAVLDFFGIKPDSTVVEIWPGGGYWTEILAPYLFGYGTYYVALPASPDPDDQKGAAAFRDHLASQSSFYRHVKLTGLAHGQTDIAPPGSADFVLTFRNIHNWMYEGDADEMFAAFYRALKPGGVLGVEEHRGATDKPQDPKAENGYVRQDYTVALAQKAGFVLDGSSEVNANPRDTKDWPKGVWTLPPTFALGAQDHDKYAAIGEADNFVLRFKKPAT
jgi:predicted methyltransferase